METWGSILIVVAVFAVGVVTPGPNFLITMKNAIRASRRIGLLTALGIAVATFLHISAGFLGVTAVIWRSALLLFVAKSLGGSYLIVVGGKALFAKSKGLTFASLDPDTAYSSRAAFRAGFLTCLSNPKSTLFYLSLFTAVIPSETPPWAQVVMLALMWCTSLAWYSTVALLFSQPAVQKRYTRSERIINLAVGSVFIVLGVQVFLTG